MSDKGVDPHWQSFHLAAYVSRELSTTYPPCRKQVVGLKWRFFYNPAQCDCDCTRQRLDFGLVLHCLDDILIAVWLRDKELVAAVCSPAAVVWSPGSRLSNKTRNQPRWTETRR